MPDKKSSAYKPLYCIVTMPTDPSQLKPDMGYYSPKELAAKENTTTTSVYSWIDHGLPVMRSGDKGNIRIYYQDYIQWMIDCAMMDRPERDIPTWAFRFVKSTEPKKAPNRKPAAVPQKAPSTPISAADPSKGAENTGKAHRPTKNAQNQADNGQLSLFALSGFAV